MAKTNGDAHSFKGVKVDRDGRNPKVHGEIPGFPVGSSWPSRVECSQAGVHAPLRAGIHGNSTDGAYSIVLSGGYEDDEDNGETITYTGQGGRDTKGTLMHQLQGKTLWEGAQSADQEWVLGNKALKISCTTKNPVRVLRGYTLKSPYAPAEGYRYDGLYVVDDAWRAIGKTGYHTCRFIFRRLPNQPLIPGSRPSTLKLVAQLKPKLEPDVEGLATPGAGPSTSRSLASTMLRPRSISSVARGDIGKSLIRGLMPSTPKGPSSAPLRPASSWSKATTDVQKSLNEPFVPPKSNPSSVQTHLPRLNSIAIVPLGGPTRGDDEYRLKNVSRSSRPPLAGVDPRGARLGLVTPLSMVQIQRGLKRPRGERVISDDARGVPTKRLNTGSQLELTPQTPRFKDIVTKGVNKYAHLKFKKQKMEN